MQHKPAECSPAAQQQTIDAEPKAKTKIIDDSCGNVEKWWLSESSGSEDDLQEQAPDPLYDPFADDEDEKWAERQRSKRCVGYIGFHNLLWQPAAAAGLHMVFCLHTTSHMLCPQAD